MRACLMMMAVLLAACAATPPLQLAVIAPTTDPMLRTQNTVAVEAALAAAHNGRVVATGPYDLYKESTIPVLPPRTVSPQGRSLATPRLFDLMLTPAGECVLVDRETQDTVPVSADCVPVNPAQD